jgi:hypothetical protein
MRQGHGCEGGTQLTTQAANLYKRLDPRDSGAFGFCAQTGSQPALPAAVKAASATARRNTPDFCAISQLEGEAAGAHVGAVRHYSAVLKVMYGAVLGFWSADRKVFEQSQRVVCTSVTLQKLQKTQNSAASCIKSNSPTHRQ